MSSNEESRKENLQICLVFLVFVVSIIFQIAKTNHDFFLEPEKQYHVAKNVLSVSDDNNSSSIQTVIIFDNEQVQPAQNSSIGTATQIFQNNLTEVVK